MNTPVVLITGALTGIARVTALAYARTGAKIVAVGRKPEADGGFSWEKTDLADQLKALA